uniref:Rho-GAP domain-containing protein n=1 Tax=Anopheles farauti TaxID=69004 RepID=A0A182QRF0_9DIPT
MLWKWLKDKIKCRRKSVFTGRRRRSPVLEVHGRHQITRQQYYALLACISYLEQNIDVHGLFRFDGCRKLANQIFEQIKSGCPQMRNYLRSLHAPRECAFAFHHFLEFYQIQVLPQRCIDIVLGDVLGVPNRLIALDILNLLREEYDSTRLHFAQRYLRLMRRFYLYGYAQPTELLNVITPRHPSLPFLFPGPNVRRDAQVKSVALLELLLSAQLLDDPRTLSAELQHACTSYRGANEANGKQT